MKILFISLLTLAGAGADPNLALLKASEWKGSCRKVVSETGKEIGSRSYKGLQSFYSVQKGSLVWWVKSFKDTKCSKLFDGNRYSHSCKFTDKDEYAACTQTTWESSKDGKTWAPKPMVDRAGVSTKLTVKVKFKSLKGNKIQITAMGENGEPRTETLSRP